MNSTIRARLEAAKAELDRLDPYPWSNVEVWIAGVRPLIRSGCKEHLDDFDAIAATPRWSSTPIFMALLT